MTPEAERTYRFGDSADYARMRALMDCRPLPWEKESTERVIWKAFGIGYDTPEWEEARRELDARGYEERMTWR